MKSNKLYALFIDFLQQQKINESFNFNLFSDERHEDIASLCEWSNKDMLIYAAFSWKDTNQGYHYWARIDIKWHKFLKEHSNL